MPLVEKVSTEVAHLVHGAMDSLRLSFLGDLADGRYRRKADWKQSGYGSSAVAGRGVEMGGGRRDASR